MGILTTYVCDISGTTGYDARDFVIVDIVTKNVLREHHKCNTINRLVHSGVALKLGLITGEVEQPESTDEYKLKTLMTKRSNNRTAEELYESWVLGNRTR